MSDAALAADPWGSVVGQGHAVTQLRAAVESGSQPDPRIIPQAFSDMSGAFSEVFLVATVLVALCIVPSLLLPRRKPAETAPGEGVGAAAMMH